MSLARPPSATSGAPEISPAFIRIAERDRARKEEAQRRRDERAEFEPTRDDLSSTLAAFESDVAECARAFADVARTHASRASDDAATRARRREEGKAALRAVNARAQALDRRASEASARASAHECRVMGMQLRDLRDALAAALGTVAPRERFRFASRTRPRTRRAASAVGTAGGDDGTSGGSGDVVVDGSEGDDDDERSPGTRDRRGETVVARDVREGEDYVLERLVDCDVFVLGAVRAIRAHELKRCRVYVAAVAGSAHLENVIDCVFCVAARQTRVHGARRTRFHLRVASRPIIEHSREVAFAPLMRYFEAEHDELRTSVGLPACENEMWREVDDFLWLRASQSPNWRELEDDARANDEAAMREAYAEATRDASDREQTRT